MGLRFKLQEIVDLLKQATAQTKELLTPKEAASLLGYEESYLYQLTSKQLIPHYKPTGKKVLFHREELVKWVLESRISTIQEVQTQAANYLLTSKCK